jgi:hypothetical protein
VIGPTLNFLLSRMGAVTTGTLLHDILGILVNQSLLVTVISFSRHVSLKCDECELLWADKFVQDVTCIIVPVDSNSVMYDNVLLY